MMKVRFAFRSRFPKQIERFIPRESPKERKRMGAPLDAPGYICPKCFLSFLTPELRKAHRKQCDFDRLAARAAKMEPRLAKMNPRQRERVESRIKEEFLKLVGRFG